MRAVMEQLRDNIAANFQIEGDILDSIQARLSANYHITWTEYSDKYCTFMLKRVDELEVALRIRKYYSKVKLSLICGRIEHTAVGEEINYAGNRPISTVKPLLETVFQDFDCLDLCKEQNWDWLAQDFNANGLDAKTFWAKFEKIYHCLKPEVQNLLKQSERT